MLSAMLLPLLALLNTFAAGIRPHHTQAAVDSLFTIISKKPNLNHPWRAESTLVVLGDATPVVVDSGMNVVVAAASYGRGRVVVCSHENMFHENHALALSIARWAAAGAHAKQDVSVTMLHGNMHGDMLASGEGYASIFGKVRRFFQFIIRTGHCRLVARTHEWP
jgi:hypothetical protein